MCEKLVKIEREIFKIIFVDRLVVTKYEKWEQTTDRCVMILIEILKLFYLLAHFAESTDC